MSQSNDRGQRPHQQSARHFQQQQGAPNDPYADPRNARQKPHHGQAHNPQDGDPQYGADYPSPDAYENPDPNAYAPQFAPYTPPADPRHAQQRPPHNNTPQPAHHDRFPARYEQPSAHPTRAEHSLQNPASADWPNTAPPQTHVDPRALQNPAAHDQHFANPHGYDAGSFASNQQLYAQHDPVTGQPLTAGYDDAAGYGHDAYATQPAYSDDPNYEPELAAGAPEGHYGSEYADHQEYADDYDGAEGTAGGTSRTMLIVGALVGAIVVGGGLAYGWKMISGTDSSSASKPPIVRSASTPSKTRPENPGGHQFDHADSKIMGRLGASRSGETAPDGTRKVVTVPVGRNGKLQPPTAPAGNETVSVPGLTVVDAFGAANRANAAQAQGASTVSIPPVVNAKTKPVTAPKSPVTPKTVTPVIISNAKSSPASKSTASTTPTKTAPVAPIKVAANPPATKTAAPTGTNGYVAVLASVPVSSSSRMNALMQYADMQQKYGSVLSNKTPDVREANLGTKGKYHRLLVGPPASRAQASDLCSKLKSAGHSSCWVTAY